MKKEAKEERIWKISPTVWCEFDAYNIILVVLRESTKKDGTKTLVRTESYHGTVQSLSATLTRMGILEAAGLADILDRLSIFTTRIEEAAEKAVHEITEGKFK